MKPDRFTDIIATNALYRPGPLNGGMVDEFVNVKNGRKQAVYLHPVLKEVLEETYGVMVFQEQVMRILNRLGGIELSKAYATIKAISKKKTEVIEQGRDQFTRGAVERGLDKDRASKIFELIVFFGGYGFNKSHSTAYAQVAYQTAYLKAHYKTEFMAAVLSSEMDGSERDKFFVEHIDDCRRMGIEVLPPNVNEGQLTSRSPAKGRSSSDWGRSRELGSRPSRRSSRRGRRKARSTASMTSSSGSRRRRSAPGFAETLIHAGASIASAAQRASSWRSCPGRSRPGRPSRRIAAAGSSGSSTSSSGPPTTAMARPTATGTATPRRSRLPDMPEQPEAERLAKEKKALGFYMSSHPLARHADEFQALATHRVADLAGVKDKAEVILGGIIVNVSVEDRPEEPIRADPDGQVHLRRPDRLDPRHALARGVRQDGRPGQERPDRLRQGDARPPPRPAELIVSRIIPIERGPGRAHPGRRRPAAQGLHQADHLERLRRAVRVHQGNLDLYLEIVGLEHIRRAIYKAGPNLRVRYDDRLILDLENAVGPGLVRLLGHRGATDADRLRHPRGRRTTTSRSGPGPRTRTRRG